MRDPDNVRQASRSDASRAVILEFLRGRGEGACFLTEVAAGVREHAIPPEEVEARLRELHAEGLAWVEEFVAPDPHLPPRILVASGIDPSLSGERAREAARSSVHRAFEGWIREFMLTHRCV